MAGKQTLGTTLECHNAQLAQWSAKRIKVYLFFEASHLLVRALAFSLCILSVPFSPAQALQVDIWVPQPHDSLVTLHAVAISKQGQYSLIFDCICRQRQWVAQR